MSKRKTRREQLIERVEQLLELENQLSEHEKTRHFNMANWTTQTPCGTSACLAGHAAMQPWFKRRGFKLKTAEGSTVQHPVFCQPGTKTNYTYSAWFAIETFFGFDAYPKLFSSRYDNDFSAAMLRVKAYLAELKGMTDEEVIEQKL